MTRHLLQRACGGLREPWRIWALALAALFPPGCASDTWTFGVSRHVYEELEDWEPDDSPAAEFLEAGGDAAELMGECMHVLILPAMILVPLAIDVVLLPVTVPHDAMTG